MASRPLLMTHSFGFTLVELSIVLVIIALVSGGIMVGQELISAAYVRAQISQIEKYNVSVNTFRTKYNGLPGDLLAEQAEAFGFTARTGDPGEGDGNGAIEACDMGYLTSQIGCEMGLFWSDLSGAEMIPDSLAVATNAPITANSPGDVQKYFPRTKILDTGVVVVEADKHGRDWFVLMSIISITSGGFSSGVPIPVEQAYAIDSKVDDGSPMTGTVVAGSLEGADFFYGYYFFQSPTQAVTRCVYHNAYNSPANAHQGCQLNVTISGMH